MNPWARARAAAESLRRQLDALPELSPAATDALLERAFAAEGLRVRARPAGDPLLSGAHAVLDLEAETIWLRADALAPERRLILAHELGHVRLHHAPDTCRCDPDDFVESAVPGGYGPRQRRETEANVFARSFLLPAEQAQSSFGEGWSADKIARRAGIPRSAVYQQLMLQGDEDAGGPSTADLASLDPSQRAAATAPTGPLLVGAGPGTGKTRTLTARILHLVQDRGVAPERILALTFSRKAADEMRERVAAVAPTLAGRLTIATFHAFGLDLLRRHWERAGLPPAPILIGDPEALALLERHLDKLPLESLRYLHDPSYPLPEVLRIIARAKEGLREPEALEALAGEDPRWEEVAGVYRVYEAALREAGAIDYADLVARPLRLFEAFPALRDEERGRWQEILVDEYQDINRAGAKLVQALAGPDGAGLWAVGDLRQAIYAFRGASPANIDQFEADFPNGRRLDLAVNYRSRPELVQLFGKASGEGDAVWTASRDGAATVTLAVADDEDAQAEGIAATIRACREAEGIAWRDVALLCRTRSQARALRARLVARDIPVAPGSDENDLLRHPEIRDILALLARVADPGGPAGALGPEPPRGFSRAPMTWPDDLLCDLLWGNARLAQTVRDRDAVQALLTLARAFRERGEILTPEGHDPLTAFLAHLRRLSRLGVPLRIDSESAGPDAVALMTVHAAKGLEFSLVFVPNLAEGRFPPRPAPSLLPPLPFEKAETLAEEERLLFVALSRARDHLVLSYAERYGRQYGRPSVLLRPLRELVPITRWERPDDAGADAVSDPDALEQLTVERPETEPETRPNVALREIELYLTCPRRFRYERVDAVPPSGGSPYGILLRTSREGGGAAAFDAAWEEAGLPETDPRRGFYRRAAERLNAAPTERPAEYAVALDHGTIRVRPDAVTETGIPEVRTLRRPPDEDTGSPALDLRLALLQQARDGASVQVRYLQNDTVLPVRDSRRARQNRLVDADRALRGIALRVFPAAPADNASCPGCPYFFPCPKDGSDGV